MHEQTQAEANLQDVMKSQGTRLSELPPWMTYAASLDEKLDPRLEEAVKRYSENRHDDSSNQNKEELHRQKELTSEMVKQYQWLTPDEYKDEEVRKGKPMHSEEFIKKLREELHVKCWYIEHPQPQKLTLLISDRDGITKPEVACWVQYGWMPEYSIMRFDDHGVPLDEKFRGWRTPLLQLILKGVLGENDVDRVFGKASGPASERYLRTLWGVRNTMVA
jgi:hypothetical protein